MAIFSDIETHAAALREVIGGDADAAALPVIVAGLSDDQVVALVAETAALKRVVETMQTVASGVVAARSTRDAGHSGLAQVRGSGSAISLLQEMTGATRADAVKQVRAGEAVFAGAVADGPGAAAPPPPWHAVVGDALLGGRLSTAQHDAIRRGLGEPPDGLCAEWASAAADLVDEARCRTVEELAAAARAARDALDLDGAQRRFAERYGKRSFRTWVDKDGVRRASVAFDDEGGLWSQTIFDAALAPRRGVRFVDPDQQARADELAADPRTTEQLAYDLFIDLLRAGALADAATVFGVKQAGVRVLIMQHDLDAAGRGEPAIAAAQDDSTTLPAWIAAKQVCDSGMSECLIDAGGNPLDLGREARLFTPAQKLTLAIRDGGCRWPGCDRPAHYCEAHHVDEWAGGGKTDVDRGILLCRFHHGQLHHGGWCIAREGKGAFLLHPPGGGAPIELTVRLARRYLWRTSPPPSRFRPAA